MLKRPKEVQFEFKQPPAPYPPSHRSGAMIGPSGVGKTTTCIAMLMGPYKNCYERVYIFSPSCAPGVDAAWDAWRKHVRIHMKVPDEEQTMFDQWEPDKLEQILERHKKVNALLKSKKQTKGYAICVVVDDFADSGDKVMHSSTNVLTSLFVRGRHLGCACWLLTQKLRVIILICRTNFCWMLVWRMRNARELSSLMEELSAILPIKTLHQMYKMATQNKHDFWYINLLNETDAMFYRNFDQRFALNLDT